jgi:eukaryotic-like serine/threonine-protein kinase
MNLTLKRIAVPVLAAFLLLVAGVRSECASLPAALFAQGVPKAPAPAPAPAPTPTAEPPTPPAETPIELFLLVGVLTLVLIGGVVFVIMWSKRPKPSTQGATAATVDVLGKYRLLRLIHTGQHSQVWEAVETASLRHFAVKILLPEHASNQEHRKFLFHEAEVGKELSHPNIAQVVHVSKDAKNPHFVMEFFPGGSVKARLVRKETEFIKEHALTIFKEVSAALAFMHAKGWVHRDIKPDNILVTSNGEVKLIDVAIAQKISKGMSIGRKGPVQGTRSYMSPEQIRNEGLDARSDIYSFGATAYEIVTGRPPFRGASNQDLLNKHLSEKPTAPKFVNPDVTDAFNDLVLKLLEKKKEDRPNNFHEVLMALKRIRVFKGMQPKKKEAEPGAE